MGNINVSIYVESRYKVNRKRIAQTVSSFLRGKDIVRDVDVSIAVVGDRKMRALNRQYRDKDQTTNVLSFSLAEGEPTVLPPSEKSDDVLRLGDVIISYPQVIQEAAEEEVLVDDKIDELIIHGVMHLLGIHHEE